MIRLNVLFRQLIMISCLLLLLSFPIFAQVETPNPIFAPINPISDTNDTQDINADDVSAPEETVEPELVTLIEKTEHHVLNRPIELVSDYVHWVDRTYPYGGTFWGTREVHLGVEFVNSRYTPVYASDDGTIVFAGSDSAFPIGPYENYYGQVIIIAHEIASLDGLQVFTLYGHLDRVEVSQGQTVTTGERIGRVGSSGIAIGAHLHFEVRVDDPFDYQSTRNPELWIQHYVGHGLIAGYVRDTDGNPIYGQRLVVRSDTVNREIFTYGSDRVNIDPVWQENFTVGDLPTDEYEIVMLNEKGLVIYRDWFVVEPYKTTFVDILIDEAE
jgi:murein DD-endopeptidase MepM/ murein hydrolase activator NlpD